MADYLKIPELARRLDVSEKTARRYVKEGRLPSSFVGGAYRVTEESLQSYLDDAKRWRETDAEGKGPAPSESGSEQAEVTTFKVEVVPFEVEQINRILANREKRKASEANLAALESMAAASLETAARLFEEIERRRDRSA